MVKRNRQRGRGQTHREEVRGNSRLRGELHEKDETIQAQAETIQSLASRIATLEAQMEDRTSRLRSVELFKGREEGFAPSKLLAGNFSPDLVTSLMIENETITGGDIAPDTIGRARIASRTLTAEEIATDALGERVLNMTFLDGRYARR